MFLCVCKEMERSDEGSCITLFIPREMITNSIEVVGRVVKSLKDGPSPGSVPFFSLPLQPVHLVQSESYFHRITGLLSVCPSSSITYVTLALEFMLQPFSQT